MYALADASGATAMTRIICWVGPRAKRLRAANKAPPKATSVILSLRAPNRWWRTRRKSALFPHCCRIATFFVSSLDAALPLPFLQHARKKIFVSNNTDKTNIVSDNCHKLRFYFLHVWHTLHLVFAGPGIGVEEERRHVVAARHANITAAGPTLSGAPRAQVLGHL